MTKQFWVLCNEEEQKELISLLSNYKIDIDNNKMDFPLVIDTELKTIYRCTSITCCAQQVVHHGKIQHYAQVKDLLLKAQL